MTRANTADRRPDYVIAAEGLSALMVRERLDVVATFVPFSQSRNKASKHRSLNWRVTLQRQGRDANTGERAGPVYVLAETDYSAGEGHCPAYKLKAAPGELPVPFAREKAHKIAQECETGRRFMTQFRQGPKIDPAPVNVFSSLLLDASVLDASGFEEWASDYGYDTDSRKAEGTYRACLDIALKLRAALGDKVMTEARDLASRI
jgi:hypothetical protein